MQSAHPVADPQLCGESGNRLPWGGHAIEEKQPETRGDDGQVERHDDRAALIERIPPRTVEAIGGRIDYGQQPKRQTLDRFACPIAIVGCVPAAVV